MYWHMYMNESDIWVNIYKENQLDAVQQYVYWQLQNCSTCFGRFLRPSSAILQLPINILLDYIKLVFFIYILTYDARKPKHKIDIWVIRKYGFKQRFYAALLLSRGAWGSVVVKALRYQSGGPGIDSRWCYWGFFFPWLPTEPCALGSTQPLKMSTRDFSGQCVRLTIYHPCSAERQENPGP